MSSNKAVLLFLSSEPYAPEVMPLMSIFVMEQARLFTKNDKFEVVFGSVSILPTKYLTLRKSKYQYINKIVDAVPVYSTALKKAIPLRFFPWIVLRIMIAFKFARMFKRIINDYGKPVVVHAHNVQYAGWLAAKYQKRHGYELVVTEHSSAYFTQRTNTLLHTQLNLVLSNAQKFITVSEGLKKQLIQLTGNKTASNILVVANVPDQIFLDPIESLPSAINKDGFENILTVANLVEVKNQQLLIEAFALYHTNQPQSILTIIGEGPLRMYLEAQVVELQLEKAVRFIGYCTKDQVKAQMCRADLFVLSSKFETYGVVVMEAMLCGLPVVTTPCGGPEELIQKVGIGVVAKEHTPTALFDAILDCEKSRMELTRTKTRKMALSHFAPDTIRAELENIYSRITNFT